MVYPLIKKFVEKTVTSSKGGSRTPGLGDSQGYRLESYKNKANSRSRPDERDLVETAWGSKDHIVAADGQVSGDDVSLPGSDKAQHHRYQNSHDRIKPANIVEAVGGHAPSHRNTWRQGAGAGTGDIIVTTEYAVEVDQEAATNMPKHSHRY